MFAQARKQLTSRRLYWRAFWLLALLSHMPLTIRAASTFFTESTAAADWARILFLSATNLFFLLEIAFAPSLKLVTNRRAAVTFLLIVAVLHAGVVENQLPGVVSLPTSQFWLMVAAVGTACCMRQLKRWANALASFVVNCLHRDRFALKLRSFLGIEPSPAPQTLQACWRSVPPRAPPRA